MTERVHRLALVALIAVGGCRGKKAKPADEQKPAVATPARDAAPAPATALAAPAVDDTELWALAPRHARIGLVAGDGALAKLVTVAGGVADVTDDQPASRRWLADARSALAGLLGIDLLDPRARRSAGIDLARGAALFLDADGAPLLVVMPAATAASLPGAEAAHDAGTPDVHVGDRICRDLRGRVVCAWKAAVLAKLADSSDRARLAELAAARAGADRGDLTMIADVPHIAALDAVRARASSVLRSIGPLYAAVDLGGGAASLRVHLVGRPGDPWGHLLAVPSADAAGRRRAATSATAVRLRVRPEVVDGALAGALGLDGASAQLLTGDVTVLGRGHGPLAGEVRLGVTDAGAARALLPRLCNRVIAPLAMIEQLDDKGCRARLSPRDSLGASALGSDALAALDRVPVVLDVDGSALRLRVGDSDPGLPAAPPVTPLAVADAQLSLRVASADPLEPVDGLLSAWVTGQLGRLPVSRRNAVAGARWALAHLDQLQLAIGFADDGLRAELAVTGVAADPQPAYQAYREALAAVWDAPAAARRARLEAVARAHPGTRAARRVAAALGGAPEVGPMTVIAALALPSVTRYLREPEGGRRRRNR